MNYNHVGIWLLSILTYVLVLSVMLTMGFGLFGRSSYDEIDIAVDYVATQIAQETATPMPSEEGLTE